MKLNDPSLQFLLYTSVLPQNRYPNLSEKPPDEGYAGTTEKNSRKIKRSATACSLDRKFA